MPAPRTLFAEELHRIKYRNDGETFRDAMNRVANALKDSDEHYHTFKEILRDMRFLPGGRIQAAMGSPKNVTAFNCYVSGTIPDSFIARDNPEQSSIMHRAEQAAMTMRMGGGIGYDFSTLRPKGAIIQKLQSVSGGPISFMPIYDAVCHATASSGNRRGAQMGVLRIDHPDAPAYINAKHKEGVLEGFNMSLAITDEFMECLATGRGFDLRFGGKVYNTIDPVQLWEALMRSTWDWAEPGVLFIDTINRWNNLYYCETIAATNPCGEQPLPPFGACLLGSFNLVTYLTPQPGGSYSFEWDQLVQDIEPVVRAMDNVTDRTIYPLEEQRQEALRKRRMGSGVTGLANTAEALGFPYGSPAFLEFEDKVLGTINHHCYVTGARLAKEKGAFPLYNEDRYLNGKFIRTLDKDVQDMIRKYGSRCSHYTSQAPTGTISQAADNVSASIEPATRWQQLRTVNLPMGQVKVDLYDYGFAFLKTRGKRSLFSEVTAQEHINVLLTAQKHTDSAVSKTVNCDGSMPWEGFQGLYKSAYDGGAKGCTTYNADGKRKGIFKIDHEPADLPFPEMDEAPVGMSCEIDPVTGRRSCE